MAKKKYTVERRLYVVSRSIRMDYNGAPDFRANDYEVDGAAAAAVALELMLCMRTLCVFVLFSFPFIEMSYAENYMRHENEIRIDEHKKKNCQGINKIWRNEYDEKQNT